MQRAQVLPRKVVPLAGHHRALVPSPAPTPDEQAVACPWYSYAMSRVRVSTTVDGKLLEQARNLRGGVADSALIDEALRALLAQHRSAEIDASYAAYDEHPLDEPDEWGDLASFHDALSAS